MRATSLALAAVVGLLSAQPNAVENGAAAFQQGKHAESEKILPPPPEGAASTRVPGAGARRADEV